MDLTPYTPGWFLEILLRPLTILLELIGVPGIFSGAILLVAVMLLVRNSHKNKEGGYSVRFYLGLICIIFVVVMAIMAVKTGQYQMP